MNESSNGKLPLAAAVQDATTPPPTLGEAIQMHAAALLNSSRTPNGMLAINPAQLYCDLQIAAVRIEVLFEALVECGMIDPAAMSAKLRNKLLAEVEQLNAGPQIAIARGSVPRNG